MARPIGSYLGGMPLHLMAYKFKDENNTKFQAEARLTTGLDTSPFIGNKLEKSKITTSLTVNAENNMGICDMLFVMKCESLTKDLFRKHNKMILGLQFSHMPDDILRFNGPSTYGAKMEDSFKLGQQFKASIGLGVCLEHTQGNSPQASKSLVAKIKKKIDKYTSIIFQGSLTWIRRDRKIALTMEHRQNLTSKTTLISRLSYDNFREGSIRLKISSLDHPEIAFSMLVPLISAMIAKIKGEVF